MGRLTLAVFKSILQRGPSGHNELFNCLCQDVSLLPLSYIIPSYFVANLLALHHLSRTQR